MGPAAARRYSLSLSVRFSVRATYGYEYPQATKGSIEISPFYGTESEQFAKHWIYNYEAWTIQELLDGRQKLQIVLLALFDKAYEWAHNLKFSEHGTWKDFRSLFQERFVGDPTPWSGSQRFPYWLYFSGATAKPVAGQILGPAGSGALLITPLKELEVATVSEYLGKHCSVHVAEYTALLMGLDIALKRGMKHLTIMCDSLTVFNQITGKWTACHWSVADLRFVVQELLDQLTTCHIVFIPKRCNAEAHALANSAIQNANCLFPKARRHVQGAQCHYAKIPFTCYKTTLCRDWEGGYCRYGMHCERAHGYQELRV